MNKTFANWCVLQNVQPIPIVPSMLARFIANCAPLGMETLWPIVQEISRAHVSIGLPDPTAGGVVASAINDISKIEPPRSWPKEDRLRFYSMPWDIQQCVLRRDKQDRDAVFKAMNEVGLAKQKLAEFQKSTEVSNGNQQNAAA